MAVHDRAALDLLIRGFQVSRAIRLVADLGLADRIAPKEAGHIDDLAAAANVRAGQLKRVVRALSAFGVFSIDTAGKVAPPPRSMLLRPDTPGSLHHAARFWTGRGSWRAWEALDVAMTGEVPHEAAWGTGRFAYLAEQQEEGRVFDAFMANFPDDRHAAVAEAYDFSNAGLIADIGGGNGEMLRQILARHPSPRGLVLDRPDVVAAITPDRLADGRISVTGRNFFEGIPAGCDTYMLVRVLHDWSDEDALHILSRCKAAMHVGSRLLVVE